MKAPTLLMLAAVGAVLALSAFQAQGVPSQQPQTVTYKARVITIVPAVGLGGWEATFTSSSSIGGTATAYGATSAQALAAAQLLIDSGQ